MPSMPHPQVEQHQVEGELVHGLEPVAEATPPTHWNPGVAVTTSRATSRKITLVHPEYAEIGSSTAIRPVSPRSGRSQARHPMG